MTRRLLVDELAHARLGWSVLHAAAAREPVARLGPRLDAILAEAVGREGDEPTLLHPERRKALLHAGLAEVVVPGLTAYGIDLHRA